MIPGTSRGPAHISEHHAEPFKTNERLVYFNEDVIDHSTGVNYVPVTA